MFSNDQFKKWIIAYHHLYEVFVPRNMLYTRVQKWVSDWTSQSSFQIEEDALGIFSLQIKNTYSGISSEEWVQKRVESALDNFLQTNLRPGHKREVGPIIALHLLIWNPHRFIKYFRQRSFRLEAYAEELSSLLWEKKPELVDYCKMRLLKDEIDDEAIKNLFQSINKELREIGIGENEPISTVELLHIFAPYYFPLVNNPVAQGLAGYYFLQSKGAYPKWMVMLKGWLKNYKDASEELEKMFNMSILKLLFEALYSIFTISDKAEVALAREAGLKFNI